jgi:Carboxylesterase family
LTQAWFVNNYFYRVVIWGYSSGGSLVEAHLFSSMSKGKVHSFVINLPSEISLLFYFKGLFSGAIYQSGHLNSECGVRSRPGAALQVLSSIMKCDQIKVKDKLECLRKVPASTLAGAINSFPVTTSIFNQKF